MPCCRELHVWDEIPSMMHCFCCGWWCCGSSHPSLNIFPSPNCSYISSRWWVYYVTEQKASLQNLAKLGFSSDKAEQSLSLVIHFPPCSTLGLEANVILGAEIFLCY